MDAKNNKLPNLQKALNMVGAYYVEEAKSQARIDKTDATGRFANSIDYTLIEGSIDIVNTMHIIEWASAKGIRPRSGSMRKMANAIARSIKKRGIIKRFSYGGSNIFDRVYKRLEERIGEDLTAAYAKDIKDKLNKI